jgi:hypothetical protein
MRFLGRVLKRMAFLLDTVSLSDKGTSERALPVTGAGEKRRLESPWL